MFFNKKRIRKLLETMDYQTTFYGLLEDCLTGDLKRSFKAFGIRKIKIHIEPNCIDIQGRYGKYYTETQVHPNEFYMSFDLIACDDETAYPLTTKDDLYNTLAAQIKDLHKQKS